MKRKRAEYLCCNYEKWIKGLSLESRHRCTLSLSSAWQGGRLWSMYIWSPCVDISNACNSFSILLILWVQSERSLFLLSLILCPSGSFGRFFLPLSLLVFPPHPVRLSSLGASLHRAIDLRVSILRHCLWSWTEAERNVTNVARRLMSNRFNKILMTVLKSVHSIDSSIPLSCPPSLVKRTTVII